MEEYELTILAQKDMMVVDKVELNKKIRTFGRITRSKVEGVKRLAYPIKGNEFALYLYYELRMEKENATKLARVLDIDDTTMRYLLVRTERRQHGEQR